MMKATCITLLVLLIIASAGFGASRWIDAHKHSHGRSASYDVRSYGAVGDGNTDDSKAFLAAWEDTCYRHNGEAATLVVPNSVFLLSPTEFEGPCMAYNINVQILGVIVAPNNCGDYGGQTKTWLKFKHVNGLTVYGGGTIDGSGSIWWNIAAGARPTALRFEGCNGLNVRGTRHLNSQRNHISLDSSHGVDIFDVTIQAPENSSNTDGIDISHSTNINIRNSSISTGDDCIAINGITSNLNITGVQCGPGHGISIGSLGKNGADDSVEQIRVRGCSFSGTQNGVRIKTWQGWTGYVRDVTFEDIFFKNSRHPIIIDQHYHALAYTFGRGEISSITYRNVVGTSADEQAIYLDCASCTDIVMENVKITSYDPSANVVAYCSNVQGTEAFAFPPVPCLSRHSQMDMIPLDQFSP